MWWTTGTGRATHDRKTTGGHFRAGSECSDREWEVKGTFGRREVGNAGAIGGEGGERGLGRVGPSGILMLNLTVEKGDHDIRGA